jgi:parvulin-like peptidyl-prolyl isomerase
MPNTNTTPTPGKPDATRTAPRRPGTRKNSALTPRHELTRREREARVNRTIMISMAGIAVLVALVLSFGWWRESVARPAEPVASVAGTEISMESFARRLDFQRKALDQQMMFMQIQMQSAGGQPELAQLYQQQLQQLQFALYFLPEQVLESMIEEQLVRQEAARRGIQVTSAEVEAEIEKTFGEQSAPEAGAQDGATPQTAPAASAQERFTEFLGLYGISSREYRSLLEGQLLFEKLQNDMGATVPANADQIRARHILVDSEEKAREIREQLLGGASFAELAAAESIDPGSKDSGGDLGWFPRGVMVEEFENAAFDLPLNQLSEPVGTNFGWHLIEVLEMEQNRPIEQDLLSGMRAQVTSKWLQEASAGPEVTRDLTDDRKNWVYNRIDWQPGF